VVSGRYTYDNNSNDRRQSQSARSSSRQHSSTHISRSLNSERSSVQQSRSLQRDRITVQDSRSFSSGRNSIAVSNDAIRKNSSTRPSQTLSRNRIQVDDGYRERNVSSNISGGSKGRVQSGRRTDSQVRQGGSRGDFQRQQTTGRRRSTPKQAPEAEIVLNRVSKAQMTSPLFRKLFIAIIAAVIILLAIFVVIPFLNNVGNYEKKDPVVNETFDIARADTTGIPVTKTLETFSLTANTPPNIDETQMSAIENAIKDIESTGASVGFVFYSTKSGYGINYNANVSIYGASSIKALYALFVCENFIETGEYSLDSYIRAGKIIDGSDGYVVGEEYNLRALMQDMLIKSSNNAFVILRNEFDDKGWNFWVDSLGCDELEKKTTNFAWFSPRSAATIWTEMYNYLNGEQTDAVKAMKEWLGQSQLSFIRSAVKAKGATAYTKPGWNKDDDPDWNSTSDSGIININGDTFVCSFMSSMSYDETAKSKLENLILQCFVTYGTLISSN